MDKDPEILEVLRLLRLNLGEQAFEVVDYWDIDPSAVGVASPKEPAVLAYFSCFGHAQGTYHYELEIPPLTGSDLPYQVVGRGECHTPQELASVIGSHLKSADSINTSRE